MIPNEPAPERIDGLMFFPVTPFDGDGHIDTGLLREFVAARMHPGVGAVFAACGTGEFHALSAREVSSAIAAARAGIERDVPLFCGSGGPLGHAVECATAAADAGATALLLMPPYLVDPVPDGLLAYIEAVASTSRLPIVVYHRGTAVLNDAIVARLVEHPGVIGIKDGIGDLALMRAALELRERGGRPDFMVVNGLPCAEVHDDEYRQAGVTAYTSSCFTMSPTIALAFRTATKRGDEATRDTLLNEFLRPFDRLRSQVPGYSVALVKAGVALSGFPVGPVRPPLTDVRPDDLEALRRLLVHGESVAAL